MRYTHTNPSNDTVFTVTEYYDGPVNGIANFQGEPHFYERMFDSASDSYSDKYRLTPIDKPIFRLAMEDWEIWRRWELAFHAGKTQMETHPALPEDTATHRELEPILSQALQSSPTAITRTGTFSASGQSESAPGIMRGLQVRWSNPDF